MYSETWEVFVRNIVWLRKHFNLSKKKMSEILGIDISTLVEIEKGSMPNEVTVDILFKAENYFGIPIKDLISRFIYDE
ncbi:MAG: helix-turn-helix transcriptional regulator [Clostridia bacterium]|nr:helix-turn-helix transcriptional regulator [Clostridia bacterium]